MINMDENELRWYVEDKIEAAINKLLNSLEVKLYSARSGDNVQLLVKVVAENRVVVQSDVTFYVGRKS